MLPATNRKEKNEHANTAPDVKDSFHLEEPRSPLMTLMPKRKKARRKLFQSFANGPGAELFLRKSASTTSISVWPGNTWHASHTPGEALCNDGSPALVPSLAAQASNSLEGSK